MDIKNSPTGMFPSPFRYKEGDVVAVAFEDKIELFVVQSHNSKRPA
jgi:hypothetical protein